MNSEKPIKADIRLINGVPRMFVEDEMVTAPMLFITTDVRSDAAVRASQSQVAHARNSGMDYVSVIVRLPFHNEAPSEEKYHDLRQCLDIVLDRNPQARIFIRVAVGDAWIGKAHSDEVIHFADGETGGAVSIASDDWISRAQKELFEFVAYIRNHPRYRGRVFGYHLEHSEWFQPGYREKGIDVSAANDRKFRSWLAQKYGDNDTLEKAWGMPVSLESAQVPRDFPNNLGSGQSRRLLFERAKDRRFIDYLDYAGELTSERIKILAGVVKRASGGENIVFAFYGYYFSLCDARSGHFALQRLLSAPEIDGFVSPVSYAERYAGSPSITATSAYMSPVDSILKAGKLWINESDQRTFINRSDGENDNYHSPIPNLWEVYEVHRREAGSMLAHGNIMYAMDLLGLGWLDDAGIWRNLSALGRLYDAYAQTMSAPSFEVALVVDERAVSMVADPIAVSFQNLFQTAHNFYRAGVSFAFESLSDGFLDRAGSYKVLFFVNPFRLTAKYLERIRRLTVEQNKTAVFLYSFGELEKDKVRSLLGMPWDTVIERKGNLAPVYSGVYYPNIFCASLCLSPAQIRSLSLFGGAHVYSCAEDNFVANDELAVISARQAGDKAVIFPKEADVWDYFGDIWYERTDKVILRGLRRGECRYLFYGDKEKIKAKGLPVFSEMMDPESI